MSKPLLSLVCGTVRIQVISKLGTLTLIGQGMLMIERVLQGVVFTWEIILSLGWVKSRTPSLYLLLKLSTLLPVVVAPNSYGCKNSSMIIYCDNTSAINISKNPVQHSSTKHIEIRHHFIRELVEDGTLTLEFIHTDDQKADLFTKPLDSKRFKFLHQNIGVISMGWSFSFVFFPHASASCFILCFV